jgi:hypothetical protein
LRGPQETVLKPGQYRLNRYLFDVRLDEEHQRHHHSRRPCGRGQVQCQPAGHQLRRGGSLRLQASREALTVPLVPRGCVGIWKDPLFPGAYYLNRQAYEVTLVDTRVQTWEYKGGYTKRIIDLSVDQQGNIQQNERSVQ